MNTLKGVPLDKAYYSDKVIRNRKADLFAPMKCVLCGDDIKKKESYHKDNYPAHVDCVK